MVRHEKSVEKREVGDVVEGGCAVKSSEDCTDISAVVYVFLFLFEKRDCVFLTFAVVSLLAPK